MRGTRSATHDSTRKTDTGGQGRSNTDWIAATEPGEPSIASKTFILTLPFGFKLLAGRLRRANCTYSWAVPGLRTGGDIGDLATPAVPDRDAALSPFSVPP